MVAVYRCDIYCLFEERSRKSDQSVTLYPSKHAQQAGGVIIIRDQPTAGFLSSLGGPILGCIIIAALFVTATVQ